MTTETRQNTLPVSLLGYYAGFSSRLIAFIVDVVIVQIATVIALWFVNVISQMLQIQAIFSRVPLLKGLYAQATALPLDRLAIVFIVISYYVFFWSIVGQTPGKALLGIRIIPVHARKMSLGRALLRYLSYFISTLGLFLGFAWVLFDDHRQAWHDKISGTYVVYTWNARPDERFLAQEIERFGQ